MKLCEVFDSKTDWKWTTKSSTYWEARMKINEHEYKFDIELIYDDTLTDHYKIENPLENSWAVQFILLKTGNEYVRSHSITGTGNELQVFTSVLEMIHEFVNEQHPTALVFSASQPSRIKLYDKMVSRLSQKVIISNLRREKVYYVIL